MESQTEVNFGKSIIVPSVQELTKEPIFNIPARYVRDDQKDPLIVSYDPSLPSVPVIDLERLDVEAYMSSELDSLHSACKDWGFFQVVNHGVSTSLLEEFRTQIDSFFKLPYEEKKNLWQEPNNQEGFGQLFVVSDEQKLDWSDMFYITTLPHNIRMGHLFDKLQPKLRETLETYSIEVKKLALTILGHMAKALKMDVEEMRELFSDGVQSMRMNYYPQCPEPDKAIGFTPHSDADALTILCQVNETEGLQIRKEGRWVLVKPLPNAFIVNIGDIMEETQSLTSLLSHGLAARAFMKLETMSAMQYLGSNYTGKRILSRQYESTYWIVSNGIYRSIEHRAIVNSTKERLSIATFYSSNLDSELGPAPSLIGPGNPANFRRVPLEKYFKEFFARKLSGKSYLDFMRIENREGNTS